MKTNEFQRKPMKTDIYTISECFEKSGCYSGS
jgi:hypothetical protein